MMGSDGLDGLVANWTLGVQIVIEKLTKNVTEAHISEIFSAYGDIKVVDMPLNRQCKLTPTVP